jgi:hypothetical protein
MPIRHPRRLDSTVRHAFPQPPIAPRMYRNIALTFFGLTILVIGAVLWMSTVRATVRVHVKRNMAKIESSMDIAKSPEQGQLQGRVVEGVFDNIQEFNVKATSGSVVNTTTTGRVRITNKYSKAQPLVKTTRLLTADGKLFHINSTVNVASNSTVEVDAYSDQPGDVYAIPSGTAFTIPGLWIDLQKWIYAEAITPFEGGKRTVKLVTSEDISDAQTSLEAVVVEQAKKTLAAEAGIPAEKLAENCPSDQACWQAVYVVTPIEKKSNVTAGQEADSFLAQAKVKVTGVFYPRKDMELLVRSKLKDKLPEGRDLADFDPSKVVYRLESSDTGVEKARIVFSVETASRLTAQSPALSARAIAGLSVQEAKNVLSNVDGVEFVEITLRPSWARRLPSKPGAIDLKIE